MKRPLQKKGEKGPKRKGEKLTVVKREKNPEKNGNAKSDQTQKRKAEGARDTK